ncbi:MAG: ribonuclease [Bacteroidota bacterium]
MARLENYPIMGKKKNEEHPLGAFLLAEIYRLFEKHGNRSFNHKQVLKAIRPAIVEFIKEQPGSEGSAQDVYDASRDEIQRLLFVLAGRGELLEVERGKFKLKPKHAYIEGIVDITSGGAAYLLSETDEDDVFIAPRHVKNALHGDRVKVFLYARHKGKRMEGEVVEILERAKTEFVGVLQAMGKYAFVVPDSSRMLVDIFVPGHLLNNAEHGQKVVATIADWPKGTKNPIGKITKVLGWPGENEAEMHSILSEFGFPVEFPERVEKEADAIPEVISGDEIKRRRDFRQITTFTIDPVDAKDFDDALSVKKMDNGNWEIGVHIADVSHYIRPLTELDNEAYDRATSVYLVDRVVPMLPEKLSNGVCSLRPHEDKLCFSAVFEMNEHAEVKDRWIGKTIIHSDHRFTYEGAQALIENPDGKFADEIQLLHELAKKLRAERFRKGAIAFEKVEVKFKLDEKGKPLGVYLKENKESNQLIEEFMLLANKTVAEFAGKRHAVTGRSTKKKKALGPDVEQVHVQELPFVYRIHDGPVNERLQAFVKFASRWGHKLKTDTDKEVAHSMNGLMKSIRGKKEQNVLEQLAIRTMSKAVYTTENIGHYGLAFDHYTHFTSPIRRYPDVLVHRLVEQYLGGDYKVDAALLEDQCKHSTAMEIRASEAERASVKYKQVEFLQDKIGQVFEGIISGVTEWGLYVELEENKCEGLVRLRELDDDFYEFDETNLCVVGARTGRRYSLGDSVRVVIAKADLLKKQIDMRLVRSGEEPSRLRFTNSPRSGKGKGKPAGKKKRRY